MSRSNRQSYTQYAILFRPGESLFAAKVSRGFYPFSLPPSPLRKPLRITQTPRMYNWLSDGPSRNCSAGDIEV
jgi:hypothetical protein